MIRLARIPPLARCSPFRPRYSSLSMPPKRASSSKRKASPSDDDDDASRKKQKTSVAHAVAGAQPTNKQLPDNISFPPRGENILRFAAWNVCGLAASQKKVRRPLDQTMSDGDQCMEGFKSYVEAEDPDVLVLTETKVHIIYCGWLCPYMYQLNNVPVDPSLANRFPHSYWAISEKKTYCKTEPVTRCIFCPYRFFQPGPLSYPNTNLFR